MSARPAAHRCIVNRPKTQRVATGVLDRMELPGLVAVRWRRSKGAALVGPREGPDQRAGWACAPSLDTLGGQPAAP